MNGVNIRDCICVLNRQGSPRADYIRIHVIQSFHTLFHRQQGTRHMSVLTFYSQTERRYKARKIPGDALSRILEEEEMVYWSRSVFVDRSDHHLCDGIR